MENSQNQIKYHQIRTSSSQLNINNKNISEDLVFLINNLNYDIRAFYQSIKQCLIEGKKNNNKISNQQILELIEQYLNDFIDKAKDTFKKMKYTQKINLIQQEINEYQNNSKYFKDELLREKINLKSEDINLNSKFNNFNNINNINNNINNFINNKSDKNKNINANKILFDEMYIPTLKNNFNNSANTSIKINNYMDKNINNFNEYNKNYKKINNIFNKNKVINKNNSHGTNYNLRKNNKMFNNSNINNNLSDKNIIFQNYNQQLNKTNKNKNTKSANNLRKKILVNNNNNNSLKNSSNIQKNNYSTSHTKNSFYLSKKEILNNLNIIISILKELKTLNDNNFNKSWEGEEYQKLLNKLYSEINNLIKNIFKEKIISYNSTNNTLYNENEDYFSGNISERSLSKNNKKLKNSDYNLTYNYKTHNIINNDEINILNEDYQKIKKTKIFYEKEIKSRDLIIKKLKNEIELKDKNILNQNIKINQLLKSKLNNNLNVNTKNINEENLNINKMSKIDIEELIESRKIIIELKEKIKNYEKIFKDKSNIESKKVNIFRNYELMNKKFNELKKSYDSTLINNEKLKKQINLLSNKAELKTKEIKIFKNILNEKNESFSILCYEDKNKISEGAQKIIDEIKNELEIKKEENDKINNEINIYKSEEIKLKEEISKSANEIISYKDKEIKMNEEISNLNNEISKYKENITKMKKEIESLNEKNNNNLNENKSLEETIDKQRKLIEYQDKEIISLKNEKKEENINKINNDSYNNINNDNEDNSFNSNNLNKEDKTNKKRNIVKRSDLLQMEQDKIVLKYELLKNDYDKLNSTLQQKQKLLDNYSKLTNETSTKTNIDEQILELISEHKKEIDELTKKYNQNIINLKMNLPIGFSSSTHSILIDKRYTKYNLRWFLLTIITTEEKNYENTFWVPEDEIKPLLDQFNKFKTEKELEDEQFESIYITQQKWIKQIDENERLIAKLKAQIQKYENSSNTE